MPESTKKTGGALVVEALENAGVEVVFGIPGGHSIPIYDALSRTDAIRHVLGRHEQGLAFMADGYSRATGRIGVLTTTSGPGVANTAGAMGGATTDTSAVLNIASAPRSGLIGKNRGGLHDLNSAADLMRPVCRYTEHCGNAADIRRKIGGLIESLRSGRRGGAFCEIPADILAAPVEAALTTTDESGGPQLRRPSTADIEKAARMLSEARRPFIIAGTGALESDAGRAIRKLAETCGAIVTTTSLARGLIPPEHPNHVHKDGGYWKPLNEVVAEADVVVAFGTMFRQEDTADWSVQMGKSLIHIDIDPDEIGRSYEPVIGMVADAKDAAERLLSLVSRTRPADPEWLRRGKDAESRHLSGRRREHPVEMAVLDALRGSVADDGVLVCDRCSLGYWVWRCLPTKSPRSFQYPMGYGGLGGALPQAIGAKIGSPDRPVICIIGDGGIQFTLGELGVAAQEGTRFPIVLCNNGAYGAIKAGMIRNYGHAKIGCDLKNPDYRQIASAYGISYTRADSPETFSRELSGMLSRDELGILDLTVDIADPPPTVPDLEQA